MRGPLGGLDVEAIPLGTGPPVSFSLVVLQPGRTRGIAPQLYVDSGTARISRRRWRKTMPQRPVGFGFGSSGEVGDGTRVAAAGAAQAACGRRGIARGIRQVSLRQHSSTFTADRATTHRESTPDGLNVEHPVAHSISLILLRAHLRFARRVTTHIPRIHMLRTAAHTTDAPQHTRS